MIGGDMQARLHALIERSPDLSPQEWKEAMEKLRLEVFGSNHKALPFLAKLHMLASCEPLDKDIFWMDDGASFAIDKDGYTTNIMSVFFNQSKLTSFQNRLSAYKFKMQPSVGQFPDDVAHKFLVYRHPSFVRDEPGASFYIRESKSPSNGKGGATKAALNESSTSSRSEGHDMDAEDDKMLIDMSEDHVKEAGDDKVFDMSYVFQLLEGSSPDDQQDQLLRDLDINTSLRRDGETADCCSLATFSMSSGSGDI
ncbi:hypothetical protein ACHAXT_011286 [Thalassiosira profunda]